jgi:hypothetical protein
MENVLFDLYIAESEMKDNANFFNTDTLKKKDLLQVVFKKHHISEAKFDSSLVWYNAHLDKYLKINTNVTARFTHLLESLEAEQERIRLACTQMDTVYFHRSPAFCLQPKEQSTIYSFRSDSDSLNKLKIYDVQFTVLGMKPENKPVLTFCIQSKDSIFVHRDTITQNGLFEKQYSVTSRYSVQSIYGTLHLSDTIQHAVWMTNFSIAQHITTLLPTDSLEMKSAHKIK